MFGQHTPTKTAVLYGGERQVFEFANGYGASVVRHEYSYSSSEGLWELAVLDANGRLTYDTPVTNDVEGYLSEGAVADLLDQIAALA